MNNYVISQEIENVRLLTHGKGRCFRCILYDNNIRQMEDSFEKHYQAIIYGKNWVMLGINKSFSVEEIK